MMIREYQASDIDAMIKLGAMFHDQGGYSHLDYDPQDLRNLGHSALTDRQNYAAFVAVDGNILKGMIAGFIYKHFFGSDKCAADLLFYVDPLFRGGTTGPRLLKRLEVWAKDSGAKDLVLGISSSIHADRTAQLYEKLGFPQIGTMHKKRL